MRNLILMGCCLALLGACAINDEEGTTSTRDPAGGADAGDDSGGDTGANPGGSSGGSAGNGGGAGGSNGGDTEGGQSSGGTNVDPKDPPVATEACGDDLDVKNGTLLPDYNTPKDGGAFADDPIAMGTLKVVLEDAMLPNSDPARDEIRTTAYGPSTDGTSIDAGLFPLMILLPGFSGNHTTYRHFTDHFVSHGFAVLGVTCANVTIADPANNPANLEDIKTALKWAIEESALKGKVDLKRMAISGHSQGGKLAFFMAATDPRFKVVLGWDPQNGGGPPCFVGGAACDMWPVAPNCDPDRNFEDAGMLANMRAETLVFAARDALLTLDPHLRAEHFYRGAPSPASMLLFPNAGHGDWAGAGATTDVSKRVQMALLLSRFMGKTGLDKYLPDGEYAKGVSSVMVYTK